MRGVWIGLPLSFLLWAYILWGCSLATEALRDAPPMPWSAR